MKLEADTEEVPEAHGTVSLVHDEMKRDKKHPSSTMWESEKQFLKVVFLTTAHIMACMLPHHTYIRHAYMHIYIHVIYKSEIK